MRLEVYVLLPELEEVLLGRLGLGLTFIATSAVPVRAPTLQRRFRLLLLFKHDNLLMRF